ncbi:MAG: tetratricopeptide repeat protein [Gloeotrichia echinulata GP01]
MSENQPLPLSIKAVISYPRKAQVGTTYMMTIDLETAGGEWLYEEEEYPIYCMLDTSPLFSYQTVGESAVVLHRFGGTYGEAKFLLTAAKEEMEGEIKVTLVNSGGVPIRELSSENIRVSLTGTTGEVVGSTESEDKIAMLANPYHIGSAIDDPNKFFGRKDVFEFIELNLLQGSQLILLHGQRRIGKSSILYQIPKSVFKDYEDERNQFSFIFFDLQNKTSKSLAEIIHDLARKISTDLRLNSTIVPILEQLEDNTDIFVRRFLPQVYQELGNKNLVLLLDEFDILDENHPNSEIENKGGGFFRYLQLLVNREQKLFIIPVVGRHVGELPKLLNLFKGALNQNIGLLHENEARQLITKPVEGVLEYGEDAIQAILELSAGHPYFTQVICFNLFIKAKNHNQTQITREDVEGIVEQAIETAEGGLDWIWHGLSIPEQVVFSAVAKAEFPEDPFAVLRKNGVIETEILIQAAEKLVEQGFVDKGQPDYTQSKVKVEFLRRWLLQRHSLEIEIWELEKIEEQIVKIRRGAAYTYHEKGDHQRALQLYEDVLKINPNHFSTVLDLAEVYSKLGNFEKAIEYYTRAYQFDPLRNTKNIVRELENYASHLFINRDIKLAKQQYQRVLGIQPKRKQAQMRLKEIEAVEPQFLWRCEGYKDEPHPPQTINIGQNCPVCNRTRDSSEYSNQNVSFFSNVISWVSRPFQSLFKSRD